MEYTARVSARATFDNHKNLDDSEAHLLTALTNLVNYQSNFKLHKQQGLLLLLLVDDMRLMIELNACQLLFSSYVTKKILKLGAQLFLFAQNST